MQEYTELRRKIEEATQEDEVVQLLSTLIRERSDLEGDQEYGVGIALQKYAAENDLECILQPVEGKRSNVLIRYNGNPEGKTLLYSGHIDVVPPGDLTQWHSDPFEPVIRDGRLYGRGSCDMKGSIAAALCAINVLKRSGIRLNGSVLFALDIDEETKNLGMDALLDENMIEADACIVGEPTSLKINIGHKGVIGFWVKFHGKRVHASRPQLGINPLKHCAALMAEVEDYQNNVLNKREHPILGYPTMTVTMIQGGKESNSVPNLAEMRIDRRYLKSEGAEKCIAEAEALVKGLMQKDSSIDGEISVVTVCPPGEIPQDDPLVYLVRSAISPDDPEKATLEPFYASCEMDMVMSGLNIPTLIFGPGNLQQAHTVDEFIEVQQLVKGTELFAKIFMEYLGVMEA